jgi:hypothetical protein
MGQLKALSDALTPTLKWMRQKEFYEDARFHASFAWAPELAPSLAGSLNRTHGETLCSRQVGCFEVDLLSIKIGRDVFSWTLRT